jgi:hypothetical protein
VTFHKFLSPLVLAGHFYVSGTNGAKRMLCYLKIAALLTIPISTLLYAKDIRIQHDMQALKWDVQHPPSLRWVVDHPSEALIQNRAEAKYLHRLIQDMDNN